MSRAGRQRAALARRRAWRTCRQRRFVYSLFDADAICVADLSDPCAARRCTRFDGIGRQPYDALVTPDGRHFIAGLFGEDGLALVTCGTDQPRVRRVLAGYGRGQQPLPVYKMPHLRGWAVAGRDAWLPAIGRHEVLVAGHRPPGPRWARIPVAGQPVFVMARPDWPPGVGELRRARLPHRCR